MVAAHTPVPQPRAPTFFWGAAVVGLLLGSTAGVAEGSWTTAFEFFVGAMAFAPVYQALFRWVLPNLQTESRALTIALQLVVSILSMTVTSFVVINSILLVEYRVWIFTRDAQGEFVALGAWLYVVLPIVPSALFAVTIFHQTLVPIRALEARAQRADELATLAQFQALRAQIDPHFLFNSLNSIAQLISTDPERAEACIQRLAEIFRYLLTSKDRTFVTLGDELEITDGYLDIERARFGDQLRVDFDVPDRARSWIVPTLILQPLVENAVRHGISKKVGGGEVRIRARIDDAELVLDVEDSGVGIDATPDETTRSNGVGLRNVAERLAHLYGAGYAPEVSSRLGQGTHITLRVPRKPFEDLEVAQDD